MADGISFMTDKAGVGLTLQQAKFCYCMSKMTVINENPSEDLMMYHSWGKGTIQSTKEYVNMKFCEFIEMIGRIVEQLYGPQFKETAPNTQYVSDGYSFANYLEFTICTIIQNVLNKKAIIRKPVKEECSSESDNEY